MISQHIYLILLMKIIKILKNNKNKIILMEAECLNSEEIKKQFFFLIKTYIIINYFLKLISKKDLDTFHNANYNLFYIDV